MSDQKKIEAAMSAATETADDATARRWAQDFGAELEKRGLVILPSHYKLTGGDHYVLESEDEFVAIIRYYVNSSRPSTAWLDRVFELCQALKDRHKRSTGRV
jgi:hypothetical protein